MRLNAIIKISKASFLFALFLAMTSPAHSEIHIAVAGPMSGELASVGKQVTLGAQMAVQDLNDSGGVNGEKIILHTADDACAPNKAISEAHRLAEKKVAFVVGHVCSRASLPASKVYAEEGIFQVTPASTAVDFTEKGGWNVARTCGRNDRQGQMAGERLAKEYGTKRIALLHNESLYGKELADQTKKTLNGQGVHEMMYQAFMMGEKEYSSLIAQLKSARIDVIYIAGIHTEIGLMLQKMRAQNFNPIVISGDSLATKEFWSIAGNDASENVHITALRDPLQGKEAHSLVQRLKKAGHTPEATTLRAYAAVQAWAYAAKTLKTTDGKKISHWLKGSGRPVQTVLGTLTWDAKGDLVNSPYRWYRSQRGKYVEDQNH